ncbi:MAG: diguanylate cyclase [Candidatus Limnocylindria bacterium]
MNAELIFIVITGLVAALLGIGALVAAIRASARRARGGDDGPERDESLDKYEPAAAGIEGLVGASYGSAVRILWWVSIAAVLIGVGLSDAFDRSQPAIYLVGAVAVGIVIVIHDLVPTRFRSGATAALEVLAAIALTTVLLTLTGFGSSPFVYGYHLVAVAVALAMGGGIGLGVAAVASLAFLVVLGLDPRLPDYAAADLLRFGLNVGAIWLLAYLAGVYASGERRMRATVLQLSRTDALTALFNRGQLFPTLEQEVQRTRRSERGFCLLMIDLDGLKAVNDSYGHHRGDEVLRSLGGVIRRSIRAVDTAYRYGGDEFLVLLPETDFAGAFVVAEKIRAGAEEVGLQAGGGEMLTSVSIGLVSCPEDGTSAEELMIAADRAMYQAKSLGKNQVSGNPRPRRLPYRPAPESAAAALHPATGLEEVRPHAGPLHSGAPPPAADVASASTEPPISAALPVSARRERAPGAAVALGIGGAPAPALAEPGGEDEEPDPSEVRRHIAAARLNMDPDHQIRRAMDAFLSPSRPNGDAG